MASTSGDGTSVEPTSGGGLSSMARLFNKPKKVYENTRDESVFVSPLPTDMIYIRSCEGCEFFVQDKAAKCIVEKCNNVTVRFDSFLLSGTLELIGCKGVAVSTKVQLPTISVDGCEDLQLTFREPRAVGAVYTVRSKGVTVRVISPEQKFELKLPTPEEDGQGFQYVSTISGGTAVTELCIREGAGYLTTEKKLKEALAREKEIEKQIEKYLTSAIKISKPAKKSDDGAAGSGVVAAGNKDSQPPSIAGADKPSDQVPKPASQVPKPATEDPKPVAVPTDKPSDQVPKPATEDPKPVVVPIDKPEAEKTPSGEDTDDQSPMVVALKAQRGGLKPTVTVVRNLPIVPSGGGKFDPSIKDEEEKKEYFDSEKELSRKVDLAAAWLKKSKHAITFTGAGISTSCGIPDFRSGMNTVLPTGPGIWELRANETFKPSRTVKLIEALPSLTHMSLVKLHEAGMVKATVSQNVDGLHRRSGLRPSELAELHGNTNMETCANCSKQYLRDFETREAHHVFDHRTSRLCDDPECRGILNDSIINFGESLPQNEVKKAFDHAEKADLCIVMGSSLRVRPACEVPVIVQNNGGKVIVCNLQKCDDFMSRLMKKLGLEVSPFFLKRRVKISSTKTEESCELTITGIDPYEDTPYSFVKHVIIHHGDATFESSSEPHKVTLPPNAKDIHITLFFHGHYAEPPHTLEYTVTSSTQVLNLRYSVNEGVWETSTE
eukprot:Em0009g1067a